MYNYLYHNVYNCYICVYILCIILNTFILQEDELKKAILVVLANKQDIQGALTVPEVHQALGLDALKNRTFQIFKTSAVKGEGLEESMEW